jgi:hypothetical protein
MVVNEYLYPVSLNLKDCLDHVKLQDRLSRASFSMLFAFITQLESMLSQMGTLLVDLLPNISSLIINGIGYLSKKYLKISKDMKTNESVEEE